MSGQRRRPASLHEAIAAAAAQPRPADRPADQRRSANLYEALSRLPGLNGDAPSATAAPTAARRTLGEDMAAKGWDMNGRAEADNDPSALPGMAGSAGEAIAKAMSHRAARVGEQRG